jgi:hypothetical protein
MWRITPHRRFIHRLSGATETGRAIFALAPTPNSTGKGLRSGRISLVTGPVIGDGEGRRAFKAMRSWNG